MLPTFIFKKIKMQASVIGRWEGGRKAEGKSRSTKNFILVCVVSKDII